MKAIMINPDLMISHKLIAVTFGGKNWEETFYRIVRNTGAFSFSLFSVSWVYIETLNGK